MRTIATIAFGLLLIPSVSFASTLTQPQVDAILSVLLAFGVDTQTVSNVRGILTNSQATTTPISIVPVNQTPIIPNQPVYFGSTAQVVQPPIPVLTPPATTSSPVIVRQIEPLVVQGVEIAWATWTNPKGYVLRVFTNIPINIASTTGMSGVSIGSPTNENTRNSYAPYWSEAPLTGIPTQINGEARNYRITIYSQDGQSANRGVSVPY